MIGLSCSLSSWEEFILSNYTKMESEKREATMDDDEVNELPLEMNRKATTPQDPLC
jgi:hypothetical protein